MSTLPFLDPLVFRVCFIGLIGSLVGLAYLLGSQISRRGIPFPLQALGITTLLGLSGWFWWYEYSNDYWLSPLGFAGILTGLLALRSGIPLRIATSLVRGLGIPQVQGILLLLGSPGAAVWITFQVESKLEREMALTEDLLTVPSMELESLPLEAWDDRGSPFVVYKMVEDEQPPSVLIAAEANILKGIGVRERFIRLGPPDIRYNCHGFVFAGGQAWIKGNDVDRILERNGYQETNAPREGDVIVYRQGDTVLHSGLVRSTLANGLTLIESKWGRAGQFLHPSQVSCYPADFKYYHNSRSSHTLQGLGQATPPAPARPG